MSEAHKKILKGLKLVNYKFKKPPLVLGGLALEYYGIRKTKHDYDYMVSPTDWKILKKKHPDYLNLFGGKDEKEVDATLTNINNKHVDLISTLFQYNYNFLSKNAIKENGYIVISLDKLLFTKTLGAVFNNHTKSKNDQKKIVKYMVKKQYPNLKIR